MLEKVKLIIWDLDETLWRGTLSSADGIVEVSDEIRLFLQKTLDAGIVHSICSKNDYAKTKAKLEELGLWDSFVFPSIDWTPKGQRIGGIVEAIQLRPQNVLFLDDNPQNLQEAEYYCKGIITLEASGLPNLFEEAKLLTAKDPDHARLGQYRILEAKNQQKKQYSSNDDFLFSCNIRLAMRTDCMNHAARLHDLVLRSNQLNYTKRRPSYEEFLAELNDSDNHCGYVQVKDNYGDYGIVGFYVERNGELIHFLFSCRTLGMHIEQYVWKALGCPRLEVIGEVVAQLDANASAPTWIHLMDEKTAEGYSETNKEQRSSMLIIGPCDMDQMYTYLQNGQEVVTEFVYVGTKAPRVENHTHIAQLATALTASESRMQEICSDSDWFDPKMLETSLGKRHYDTVVLSTLPVSNGGVYRRIKTGELISFGENYYDLTDEKNYEKAIQGKIFTNCLSMTLEQLRDFRTKYEKIDFLNEESICASLNTILKAAGDARLILILGTETEYLAERAESYIGRHLVHKRVNAIIRKWASGKAKVDLLSFDSFIHSQDDFTNLTTHYVKRVYFELAREIVKLVQSHGGTRLESMSRLQFYLERTRELIMSIPFIARWYGRFQRRILAPLQKCLFSK